MARPAEHDIQSQAIAWHLRLADASEEEWNEFTHWLEADERHNDAYEAICDADHALEPAIGLARQEPAEAGEIPVAAVATGRGTAGRRRWMWPAMAASFALVAVGSWAVMGRMGQEYTVSTAPGESRTLALSDGSRIALNGGTELVLSKSDPRVAELKSGEAQFSIRHDAGSPFALTVGAQRIVDVGTVFNVRSSGRGLQVEVAEGAVRFEDGVTRLRLNAGDTLDASGDRLVEGTRAPADIGSWTRGKLVYREAPLVEVAGDITRARGIAIELGPELSHASFTGVIQLDGDNASLRRRVELLIGAKVTETADGWSITR
ncbi:FecR family protein [Novosphingobium sp. PhB165]|uniref:FecR family protein n=1 Tax=Novosphingobium sp. PhB165 TaxID=2485105 RepID=UPI001043676D|nr:FecR domain-containing protein [Novosphingobium sp. PhB165]TCM20898.1 FecR family protein [Novosphingobium sp. PhB165]